jgi:O-antigen/teichoic acid export membrane protein
VLSDSAERVTRRVAKNGLAQIVRLGATMISKLLIVVVIARWRGVGEVGDFTFVLTYTLALGFLSDLGLTVLLIREIAKARERVHDYVENALTIAFVFGTLSIFAMGLSASALGYKGEIVTAVYLAAIAQVLDDVGNLYVAAFSGYERMELGALGIVIQELSFLVVGAVVLYLRLPFLWLFVIYILSRFISLVVCAQIYWKLWGKAPRLGFDWPVLKLLGRKTMPFAVSTALSPIFARFDVLQLSYFKGNVEVGYYEIASTLFYRLNVLARFYNLAIMPLIANQYPIIGDKVVGYVKQALKYQTVIGAPLTAISLILGGPLIVAVYGGNFQASVLAFQIMSTAIYLRLVDNTLGVTLTAMNMEGPRTVAVAVLAAFNVVANLFAIPRYGYLGAAATSVITEVGYFVYLYVLVRTRLPNPFGLDMLRPFLASLVMALPLLLLNRVSVWLLLPLGLVLYAVLALPLRVITLQEMEFLLRVGKINRTLPIGLRRLFYSQTPPE